MAANERRTVLVVDDDPSVVIWLTRSLDRLGYQVLTAEDGFQADTILRSVAVDALILDLHLKSQSGLDVLAEVRSHTAFASMPILILTGSTRLTDAEQASITGHGAFVVYKPASIIEIDATLSWGLQARQQHR